MPKPKTADPVDVLMAIDASGSMYRLADDVIGGFNQYIDDLKKDVLHSYRVTLVLFDTEVTVVHKAAKLSAVYRLDDALYRPRGGTALFDAIGGMVSQHDAAKGSRPLVVIHTDGEENMSRTWRLPAITQLVKDKTELGWGFTFLGAGLDVWQQGDRLGMSSAYTLNTREGTRGTYSGLSYGTVAYAAGASAQSVTETASRFSQMADANADEVTDGE